MAPLRRALIPVLLLLVGQTTAPGVRPVPTAAQQSAAHDLIHKLYDKDFARKAPADRAALAKLLLAQANDTADDVPARYVCLTDAIDLAAGAGDAATAVAAADALARDFVTADPVDLRRQALARALTAATPQGAETVVRLALDTADVAAAADAFDAVRQLADLAEAAANKTGQVRVVSSIQLRLTGLRELSAEYAQVRAALARLDKHPDDPAAHRTVGRFYALSKGQWGLGLPHLARSDDADLRALATQDLAKPADGFAQAQLGDAWWAYAEKAAGPARAHAAAHAAEWYKAAEATIKGITLARIQARLQAGLADAGPSAATRPAAGAPAAVAAPAAGVNLLALVDPAKDAVQGTWTRAADGVVCDSSGYATCQFPYAPPDEYDLVVAFTRTEGSGPVALLLAARGRAFDFALDVKGEARFERVDAKIAKDNPTVVPVAVSNGRRYTLTVQVRKDAVRALLDDKLLTEHKSDLKDLSRYTVWKAANTALCGVGANNAKVTFHSAQLVELAGTGKPTRP
jgi:hypothetical protein